MTCQDYSALPRSAQAAREVGARHYFTGKPCPRGHVGPRHTSAMKCCECGLIEARIKRGGDVTGQIDRRYTVPVECKIDGCDRQAEKLGMCQMHWKRQRRHGSADVVRRKPNGAQNHCGKKNCPGAVSINQHKRLDKLAAARLEKVDEVRLCQEDGCEKTVYGKGLCVAHYQRARYHAKRSVKEKAPPRKSAHRKVWRTAECRKAYAKQWREKNKERRRAYYESRKDIYCEHVRNWRRANPERARAKDARSRERNKARPVVALATRIRSRIRAAIRLGHKGLRKADTTINLLGCSYAELKRHVERQFTKGMTWNKLFSGEIELDHIQPVASFNLNDPAEQRACFHFTNVQPLWLPANREKSDKRTLLL